MFRNMTRNREETTIDVINVIVGICLALAPFVLGFTAEAAAAWNAWIVGAAIALIAIGALVSFAEWEEWANLFLGVWAVIAPWALGFTAIGHATTVHVVAGLIVAVLAALDLWFVHHRPISASR